VTMGVSLGESGGGEDLLCIGMLGRDAVVVAGLSDGSASALVITWDELFSFETRLGSSRARGLPMVSAPAMFLFIFCSSSFEAVDIWSRRGELGGVSKAIGCGPMQI
jgi:hypothetical protein